MVSPYLERASRRAQIDTMAHVLEKRLRAYPDFQSAECADPKSALPPSAGTAALSDSTPPVGFR
jgi:hypothetical protein